MKTKQQNGRKQGLTVWTEPRSSETEALEAGEAGFCSDVFEKRRNKHPFTDCRKARQQL